MFGVRGAESFQAEYQRLVEVWLRRITDLEERLDRASQNLGKSSATVDKLEQSKITISDNKGNVLYDETQDKKVCSISPEQMQQLEEALTSEAGEIVEGLSSFKVEIDKETFFESESEKIVVNKKLVEQGAGGKGAGSRGNAPIPPLPRSEAKHGLQSPTPLSGLHSGGGKSPAPPLPAPPLLYESAPALEGDVKVFLSENGESELVYGKAGQRLVDKLTDEQVDGLKDAADLRVGSRCDELVGLKVKVGDEILFQADSSGNVLVKDVRLKAAVEQIQEPAQVVQPKVQVESDEFYYDDYYDEPSYPDNYSQEQESEEVQPMLEQNDALTNALVEMIVPIIEALPAVESPAKSLQKEEDLFFEPSETLTQKLPPIQEEETLSTRVGIPTQDTSVLLPQKSGLDVVQEALGEMKEGNLKSLLQGMTTDMQATGAQQLPNPAMDTLLSERTQDKTNPQWWQQLGNKLDSMVTAVRENFIQHRAASTMKDLANRMALQPGDSFEGADYNLSRVGKDYTLTDKQGNELMKFQSSPLGVKVDQSLPALDDSHFNKTEQLRQDFKEGRSPSGSFMSQGAAEAKNIKRINTITQALSQYAMAQGGKASVEGKFNYSFEASSSGSAIIRDSEGKALLAVGGGHMRSRMSEKDLQHFEQMLPALGGTQKMQQQPVAATSGKGKQKGIGSRE